MEKQYQMMSNISTSIEGLSSDIHRGAILRMSIQQVRLARLQQLLASHYLGNVAALARALDRSPTQTRAILNPEKTGGRWIGERQARSIEKALSLPTGWLDRTDEEGHDPAGDQADITDAGPTERVSTNYDELITSLMDRLYALKDSAVIDQTLVTISGVISLAEPSTHPLMKRVSLISSRDIYGPGKGRTQAPPERIAAANRALAEFKAMTPTSTEPTPGAFRIRRGADKSKP